MASHMTLCSIVMGSLGKFQDFSRLRLHPQLCHHALGIAPSLRSGTLYRGPACSAPHAVFTVASILVLLLMRCSSEIPCPVLPFDAEGCKVAAVGL